MSKHQRDTSRDDFIRARVDAGDTLQMIGDALGITRERVRQIANRILPKDHRLARRREALLVEFVCPSCGVRKMVSKQWRQGHSFCRPGCKIDTHGPSIHWFSGRGLVRSPITGKGVRAERYLAEKRLGRPLHRNEWVVLLDGDPTNLSDDNIAILTPTEVQARRDARKREKAA